MNKKNNEIKERVQWHNTTSIIVEFTLQTGARISVVGDRLNEFQQLKTDELRLKLFRMPRIHSSNKHISNSINS